MKHCCENEAVLTSRVNTGLLFFLIFCAFAQSSVFGIIGVFPANWAVALSIILLVLLNRKFKPVDLIAILGAGVLLIFNCLLNIGRLGMPQFKALVLTAIVLLAFGVRLQGLNHRLLIRSTCLFFCVTLAASMVLWVMDISLAQIFVGKGSAYSGHSLAAGFFANPNAASHFYLMALIVNLIFIRHRPLKIMMAGFALFLILLSYSRATLLAALICLVAYWVLSLKIGPGFRKNLKLMFWAAGGVALLGAGFILYFPEAFDGLLQKITQTGFSYRLSLWKMAWYALTADVLTVWFGQGVNTLALPMGEKFVTAHNAYLNTAANLGLFYLAVLVAMIALAAMRLWTQGNKNFLVAVLPLCTIGFVSSVLFEGAYGLWVGLAWMKLVMETPTHCVSDF